MSLAAVTITPMFRFSRAALINVYSTEYVQMAEIKGLNGWRIFYRHALPNAAGPIANAIALALGNLFFGLVIIEIIFSYPGLGSLLVTAASHRDMPLVLACSLISAVVFISANLLADSIGILANPRVRFPSNPGQGLWTDVKWRAGRIYSSPRFTAFAGLGLLVVFTGAAVDWSGYGKYDAEALSVAAPVNRGARDKLTLPGDKIRPQPGKLDSSKLSRSRGNSTSPRVTRRVSKAGNSVSLTSSAPTARRYRALNSGTRNMPCNS